MPEDIFQLPSSRLRAGVARGDITPPRGIHSRCWGASLHDTAASIHHPLAATALALQSVDGGPTLMLLSLDLSWFEEEENRVFLARLREASGLNADNLLVNLCHSHASPSVTASLADCPGGEKIGPYFDAVVATSIRIVSQAMASLTPAWMTADYGRCNLAANRNYVDTEFGQTVCGFNPHDSADDTVAFARITADEGSVLATVLNYGCHPTSLGPLNTAISSDYVASARRILEEQFGGHCLFVISPCGDTCCRQAYASDPDVADRNGRQLGHAAASVAESLLPPGEEMVYAGPLISGATLATWARRPIASPTVSDVRSTRLEVPLPLRKRVDIETLEAQRRKWRTRRKDAEARLDDLEVRNCTAMIERLRRAILRQPHIPAGDSLLLETWVWQLGRIVFVGIPAEPFSLLQVKLRDRFPHLCIFIGVLTNGACGYLLAHGDYDTGLFQQWISSTGRGGLERLIDALTEQIATWNPS